MPSNPGKQKRAQKQKKKRAERQKARSGRVADVTQRYLAAQQRLGAQAPKKDMTEICGYDADAGPAEGWLTVPEEEQMERVSKYHELTTKPGQKPPNVRRHVGMHVLVEQQLASGVPQEATKALARLRKDGMSRHDAVHAIGFILTEHMQRAMETQQPVDEAAYARELSGLTLAKWVEMARSILG